MEEKVVTKKTISKSSAHFNAEELYKFIVGEIIKNGHIYVEKEQNFKPDQYGGQTEYTLLGLNTFDGFAKSRLEIEVKYNDVNKTKSKGKTVDEGDLNITIKGIVIYDYTDQWEKSDAKRFMFNLYKKFLKKKELKAKYLKPTFKIVDKIQKSIKKHLELY